MSAIPTNLYAALNGLADAAKANNDADGIAIVQKMAQKASFSFGASYFQNAAASAASGLLKSEWYPAGSVTPSHDTLFDLGVANIPTIGG